MSSDKDTVSSVPTATSSRVPSSLRKSRSQHLLTAQLTGTPLAVATAASDPAGTNLSPQVVDRMSELVTEGVRYNSSGNTSYKDVWTVPPYVLARLAKQGDLPAASDSRRTDSTEGSKSAKASESASTTGDSSGQTEYINTTIQGSVDPFTETFQKDSNATRWNDFLQTVKAPTADPRPQTDSATADEVLNAYHLNSRWKGETRLVSCFRNGDMSTYLERSSTESSCSTSPDLEKCSSGKMKRNDSSTDKSNRYYTSEYWMHAGKDTWKRRINEWVFTNVYVSLIFRIITLILCAVALAVACKIVASGVAGARNPSSIMAVAVEPVAIVYILYTTYDEFNSEPLGLRNPTAKIRLILLDLLFIIFGSANLALSYNDIFDPYWLCRAATLVSNPKVRTLHLCNKVKALTSFLFLILVAWCITFTISVFRVVHVFTGAR